MTSVVVSTPVPMRTAVTKIEHPAAQLIRDASVQFVPFLPRGTDVESIAAAVYLEAQRVPQIMECDHASIVTAAVRLVKCGFDIGRTGFLVPFKGKCTDVPHYRGYIEVITASGAARDCDAREVRVGDLFEYEYGTNGYLKHIPGGNLKAGEERGAITHSYALWYIGFSRFKFEVMNAKEVGAIHAKSAQWSRTPLQSIPWYWVKSAVRKSSKLFAQNPKLAKFFRILEEDETAEFGEPLAAPVVDAPVAPADAAASTETGEQATDKQVALIEQLAKSHHWAADEVLGIRRKLGSATKDKAAQMIDRMTDTIKERENAERAEKAKVVLDGIEAAGKSNNDDLPF